LYEVSVKNPAFLALQGEFSRIHQTLYDPGANSLPAGLLPARRFAHDAIDLHELFIIR
jgi:hypothetical protein